MADIHVDITGIGEAPAKEALDVDPPLQFYRGGVEEAHVSTDGRLHINANVPIAEAIRYLIGWENWRARRGK